MLTVLLYSVSLLWAAVAIVALVLCDVSAQREARSRVVETQRRSRQRPARLATPMRGF
jgi:hypothetical protein